MKTLSFIALSMMLSVSTSAFAQEETTSDTSTTTTIQKSDVVPADKEVKDIDDEIKNKKLRAELGSKKKLSISTSLGFSGGSIEKPLDRRRPNYREAGAGALRNTSISGAVALKYRLTERDSLSFGTGVYYATPFHNTAGEVSKNVNRDNGTALASISTPYISWSRAYSVGGIQNITSAGYSHTTIQESIDLDKSVGSADISQTILGSPVTGLDLGVAVALSYELYSDGTRASGYTDEDGAVIGETRPDIQLGVYPFLEYALTEKASFRTVFGYFNYQRTREASSYDTQKPYQSMGIGYSITRDIYIYPNLQFRPDDLRADKTNVAFSTTINL